MDFRKYLQSRIDTLTKQHQETKDAEDQTDNAHLRLSYNSHAASLFATKYELELAMQNYNKCPNDAIVNLLIESTDELLYIIRNNDKLKHSGEISRIMNESRDLIHEVRIKK